MREVKFIGMSMEIQASKGEMNVLNYCERGTNIVILGNNILVICIASLKFYN